jgi:predicted RNA binding protein YcfA (HicA-like mRNA interferase family)
MGKIDKIFAKMKQNPRDWRIESVKIVAKAYHIEWRQKGTSHVVFIRKDGKTLPIPAHRPIKPIYIQKFIDFVENYNDE